MMQCRSDQYRYPREKLRAILGYVERVNLNTAFRTDTNKLYLCIVVVVVFLSNTVYSFDLTNCSRQPANSAAL